MFHMFHVFMFYVSFHQLIRWFKLLLFFSVFFICSRIKLIPRCIVKKGFLPFIESLHLIVSCYAQRLLIFINIYLFVCGIISRVTGIVRRILVHAFVFSAYPSLHWNSVWLLEKLQLLRRHIRIYQGKCRQKGNI